LLLARIRYTGNLITINEAPTGHINVANLQIVDGSAGANSVHFLVNAVYKGQAVRNCHQKHHSNEN